MTDFAIPAGGYPANERIAIIGHHGKSWLGIAMALAATSTVICLEVDHNRTWMDECISSGFPKFEVEPAPQPLPKPPGMGRQDLNDLRRRAEAKSRRQFKSIKRR